jgi:hypothetical protein
VPDRVDGNVVRSREFINSTSPHARAFAALTLHHLVALLEQTFAFTIFAFLLLLDVRAFFTRHEILLPRTAVNVLVRQLGETDKRCQASPDR